MKRSIRTATFVLFCFYLLALVWIILFKMCFLQQALDRIRLVNLVPLAESRYADGRLNVSELRNNVLIFVPFGMYLAMLWKQSPAWRQIAAAFGVSLLLECLQYSFAIGVSDVTDLIGNTAGGAIGTLLFAGFSRVVKKEGRADQILFWFLLTGSIGFLAFVLLLFLANRP